MERLNKSEMIFKVIAYSLIALFSLIALYPVMYAFSASVSGKIPFESGKVILLPKDPTIQVYDRLYNDKAFWISYINTLYYTVYGTLYSMIISTCGAYALSKSRLLFKRKFNLFIVFTMWFSAGFVPSYLNYMSMGVNTRVGIILAFGIQAYNIILLRNYFEGVPKEIEEAAIIDGANDFQIFYRIYMPMSKAALATVTLFYATGRWNGYFWSSRLLRDYTEHPLQVYVANKIDNYQRMFEGMVGDHLPYSADSYMYAILVCSIIPVLIVYPYIQKYFAKGVNLGGVKG